MKTKNLTQEDSNSKFSYNKERPKWKIIPTVTGKETIKTDCGKVNSVSNISGNNIFLKNTSPVESSSLIVYKKYTSLVSTSPNMKASMDKNVVLSNITNLKLESGSSSNIIPNKILSRKDPLQINDHNFQNVTCKVEITPKSLEVFNGTYQTQDNLADGSDCDDYYDNYVFPDLYGETNDQPKNSTDFKQTPLVHISFPVCTTTVSTPTKMDTYDASSYQSQSTTSDAALKKIVPCPSTKSNNCIPLDYPKVVSNFKPLADCASLAISKKRHLNAILDEILVTAPPRSNSKCKLSSVTSDVCDLILKDAIATTSINNSEAKPKLTDNSNDLSLDKSPAKQFKNSNIIHQSDVNSESRIKECSTIAKSKVNFFANLQILPKSDTQNSSQYISKLSLSNRKTTTHLKYEAPHRNPDKILPALPSGSMPNEADALPSLNSTNKLGLPKCDKDMSMSVGDCATSSTTTDGKSIIRSNGIFNKSYKLKISADETCEKQNIIANINNDTYPAVIEEQLNESDTTCNYSAINLTAKLKPNVLDPVSPDHGADKGFSNIVIENVVSLKEFSHDFNLAENSSSNMEPSDLNDAEIRFPHNREKRVTENICFPDEGHVSPAIPPELLVTNSELVFQNIPSENSSLNLKPSLARPLHTKNVPNSIKQLPVSFEGAVESQSSSNLKRKTFSETNRERNKSSSDHSNIIHKKTRTKNDCKSNTLLLTKKSFKDSSPDLSKYSHIKNQNNGDSRSTLSRESLCSVNSVRNGGTILLKDLPQLTKAPRKYKKRTSKGFLTGPILKVTNSTSLAESNKNTKSSVLCNEDSSSSSLAMSNELRKSALPFCQKYQKININCSPTETISKTGLDSSTLAVPIQSTRSDLISEIIQPINYNQNSAGSLKTSNGFTDSITSNEVTKDDYVGSNPKYVSDNSRSSSSSTSENRKSPGIHQSDLNHISESRSNEQILIPCKSGNIISKKTIKPVKDNSNGNSSNSLGNDVFEKIFSNLKKLHKNNKPVPSVYTDPTLSCMPFTKKRKINCDGSAESQQNTWNIGLVKNNIASRNDYFSSVAQSGTNQKLCSSSITETTKSNHSPNVKPAVDHVQLLYGSPVTIEPATMLGDAEMLVNVTQPPSLENVGHDTIQSFSDVDGGVIHEVAHKITDGSSRLINADPRSEKLSSVAFSTTNQQNLPDLTVSAVDENALNDISFDKLQSYLLKEYEKKNEIQNLLDKVKTALDNIEENIMIVEKVVNKSK